MTPVPQKRIGVVVVAFNAEDFILDCIVSVLASEHADVRLVVVDNASPDRTTDVIRDWAAGNLAYAPSSDLPISLDIPTDRPEFEIVEPGGAPAGGALAPLTLVEAHENGGFASGVNLGLRVAMADPSIDHFWVLNPDSVATPEAAAAFLAVSGAHPDCGVITGRACYYHDPNTIQIDGGLINRWTGVTSNANVGQPADAVDMPDGTALDFAFGGNMVVTRAFVESCGEMPEDYFLYYEEVDWSLRKGRYEMRSCQDGLIYHRAGASIGSPIFGGRAASPFSLYFKHRARMMFVRRYLPAKLPVAAIFTCAKSFQVLLGGDAAGAWAILRGGFGLGPPRNVAQRLNGTAISHLAPAART